MYMHSHTAAAQFAREAQTWAGPVSRSEFAACGLARAQAENETEREREREKRERERERERRESERE
jgi:hypothetical protein